MTKKVLSMLLALVMLIGTIPTFVVSAATGDANGSADENGQNTCQIEYEGEEFTQTGVIGSGNDASVTVSKKISPTEKENYFDITLKIDVEPSTPELKPVDVVIVLDASNTMNADYNGNSTIEVNGVKVPIDPKDARLYDAKLAVNQFVDAYGKEIQAGNIDAGSRLSVVTFNTNAQVEVPLSAVDSDAARTNVKNTVMDIVAPGIESHDRFTNIEAGLKLAQNILDEQSEAKYKYIILLTDGFPTTYINRSSSSNVNHQTKINGYDPYTSSGTVGKDGVFYDAITQQHCDYGTSYSDKAARKAQTVAADIKENSKINIFSIGFALGSQSIKGYERPASDGFSVIDRESTTYAVGTSEVTYRAWLEDKIAGGPNMATAQHRYSDGTDGETLSVAFSEILNDIRLAPVTSMRTAYTLDPMSKYTEFLHFYDVNGNKTDALTLQGQSKENKEGAFIYENTATFTPADGSDASNPYGTINWDMMTSGFTRKEVDHGNGVVKNHFIYELKYAVRLTNEAEGFAELAADAEHGLPTNLETSFKYDTITSDGTTSNGTIPFKIPENEGYLADLTFRKVSEADEHGVHAPLANVEFTLIHYGNSCTVCNGNALIESRKAYSDENGNVVFQNLPSGHDYLLIETYSADDYYPTHSHRVTVYYDQAVLHTEHHDANGTPLIINKKVVPVTLTVNALKTLDGQAPEAGKFQFVLESVEGNAAPFDKVKIFGTNKADGSVTFSPMYFDNEGTYNFTVREIPDEDDSSILYDEHVYSVQIVVTKMTNKDDAEADSSIAYKEWMVAEVFVNGRSAKAQDSSVINLSGALILFENFTREAGTATLEAAKNVKAVDNSTEAASPAGFVFKATDKQGNVTYGYSDETGKVIFPEMTYNKAGTYEYTIEEDYTQMYENGQYVSKRDGTIRYDLSKFKAVVTVTAEGKEAFKTSVAYFDAKGNAITTEVPAFTNYDRGSAVLTLSAQKFMNDTPAEAGKFQFVLKDAEGNVLQTKANGENGVIIFDALTFDKDDYLDSLNGKQFNYTIEEVPAEDTDAIFTDSTKYDVSVYMASLADRNYYTINTVVKNGDTVVAQSENSHVSIALDENSKYYMTFNNADREAGEIQFTAEKFVNGAEPAANDFQFVLTQVVGEGETPYTQTVNNVGSTVTFDKITYTKTGTYEYTISEVPGSDVNMLYDESVYTITVEVKASATEAGFDVKVTSVKKDGVETTLDNVDFNNNFRTPVSIPLSAEKYLDNELTGEEFTFELYEVKGEEKTFVEDVTNGTDGKINFTELSFDKAGTYYYTISEKAGSNPDIAYDTTVYDVVVTVEPDDAKSYKTNVVITKNGTEAPVVFNNTTRKPVKTAFEAQKLVDTETPQGQTFTFELKDDKGTVLQTKTNTGGMIVFDEIEFTGTGTYKYTITEVKGDTVNMIYDPTVYNVTVDVTPSETGATYEVSKSYTANGEKVDEIIFRNSTVIPAKAVFTAEKYLDNEAPTEDEVFTFELKDAEGNVVDTQTNNGTAITFKELSYDAAGTYTYTITEKAGEYDSIFSDKTVYTVTVEVTLSDDGTRYVAGEPVITRNGETAASAVFNNTTRKSTQAALNARKNLDGIPAAGSTFAFELKDKAGNVLQTVNNNGSDVQFAPITYTEAGTYEYTISEKPGSALNIYYDSTVYDVTVNVTPSENEAGYDTEVTVSLNGTTVPSAEFNNTTRIPDPGKLNLTAQKLMDGQPTDKEFEFVLKDEAGNVLQTVTNNGAAIAFAPIEYKAAGTYKYTISENVGTAANIIYDNTVYNVTVEVTVDADGLNYVPVITGITENGAAVEAMVFENSTRIPDPAQFAPYAEKYLDDNVTERAFEFELKDAEGNVLQTVANNGASVAFAPIEYKAEGTHTYTVSEKNSGLKTIIYDETVYTVTVDVTLSEDGTQYVAVPTYSSGTDAMVFNNYTRIPDPGMLTLTAQKLLDGQPTDLVFEFELKDAEGNVLQTAVNNGTAVAFEEISYNEAGTYTYTISEKIGTDAAIIYDETVYDVTVDVVLSEDGVTYEPTAVITLNGEAAEAAAFNNYTRIPDPGMIYLGAQKYLDGAETDMEFQFVLKDEAGNVLQTVTNNGTEIAFDAITFEDTGVYTYTISEAAGSAANIIYDNTVYVVTVEATLSEDRLTYEPVITSITADGEAAEAVIFRNETRIPDPGTIVLTAQKLLDGQAADQVFAFELKDEAGNVLQTVTNDGAAIAFEAISYDAAGTYYYTITEKAGTAATIIYDKTVYGVTVEVALSADGVTYEPVITGITADGEAAEAVVFRNETRIPDPGAIILTAQKLLDGQATDREFAFELKDAEGNVLQTVTNNGAEITFEAISYEEEGTYQYTISEKIGTDADILYDETVYNVTVTVTTAEDGVSYEASVMITNGEEEVETAVFNNQTIVEEDDDDDDHIVDTGDHSNPMIWVGIMGGSALVIAITMTAIIIIRKRVR